MLRKSMVILLLFSSLIVNAENPQIHFIREKYGYAMDMVEREYPEISYTLTTEQVYGGIGYMLTTIKFYHILSWENEELSDPYNRGTEPKLLFVTIDYNIAAAGMEHTEYLFDAETEELLFYYNKNSTYSEPEEERWYFYNNGLIRVKINNYEGDVFREEYFTEDDILNAAGILAKAEEYWQTFISLYYLDRIEKWDE